MRLIIDGTHIELSPDEVLAVTLTANSLEDASLFQSSYTNEFSIPPTKNNLIALGNIPNLDSTGNEYLETDCQLFNKEGLPIVADGKMLIREFTANELKINIIDGVANFFDEIGEKMLYEIDLSSFAHTWNLTNATNESPNVYTDGYAYAVADFGNLVTADNTIDVREIYPSTFVKQLFLLIASQFTSYSFSESEYFVDSFFEALVVPFNGDTNPFYTGFEFSYIMIQEPVSAPTTYDFSSAVASSGSDENSNFSAGYFTAPSDRTLDYKVTVSIDIDTYTSGTSAGTADIVSSVNGVVGTVTTSGSSGGGHTNSSTVSLSLVAGETLTIDFDVTSLASSVLSTFDVILESFPPEVTFGSTLNLESLMPDISCVDFIKAIWQMLGLQADVNTSAKVITLRDFETYSTDTASAQDWSDKVDSIKNIDVEYSYGSYGEENAFKYKTDSTIVTDGFADGLIEVSNKHLPDSYTAVDSAFAPTDSIIIKSGALLICTLPILDATPAIVTQLENRICYLKLYTGTRPALAFTDGSSTNNNVTYSALKFVDPNESENLSFNSNLLTERFAQFALMLQAMQKVTLNINLSPLDFNNLDFFKLKYISISYGFVQLSGYFLLQEVKEYKGGGTVECELINVNIV